MTVINKLRPSGKACQVIRLIDTILIDPDPDQPRLEFAAEPMRQLTESIKKSGQRQAIEIRKNPNKTGHFILIAGERRWRACTTLGIPQMKAIIFNGTAQEAFRHAIIDNFNRVPHTPLETAYAIAKLMKYEKCDAAEAAEFFGRGEEWAKRHLILLQLNPRVLEFMQEPIPPRERLKIGVAIALLPLPFQEQYELALYFYKTKTTEVKARRLIEQRLIKRGLKAKPRERRHIRESVDKFTKRTLERTEYFAEIPTAMYANMFQEHPEMKVTIIEQITRMEANLAEIKRRLQAT